MPAIPPRKGLFVPVREILSTEEARRLVLETFEREAIVVSDVAVREYPDETIFVVQVPETVMVRAAQISNRIDNDLASSDFPGFVTVRKAVTTEEATPTGRLENGVRDQRAERLARLVTERSRTSEAQPSLSYVKDAAANISAALAARHQLIFGRRGAGKTALMLEAKRLIDDAGDATAWINVQTLRRESAHRIVLWTFARIAESLRVRARYVSAKSEATDHLRDLADRVEELLGSSEVPMSQVAALIPVAQRAFRRFGEVSGLRLFVFLDDFHYVSRRDQPEVLDLLHGSLRDCDAWLKVASIRHLTRWYQPSPQMGLQTGQDADVIDLDVTLQDPLRAKVFLEDVLSRFAIHVGIPALWQLFHPQALDRLVLASGAVPRDYLVLAAAAIRRARSRPNARQVGGQDVNNAAGEAAQVKVGELEEDLAGSGDLSASTLAAFQQVRRFCLEDTKWTYFKIDFRDKEKRSDEYSIFHSVVDLRLVHLINPSVSHESRAGERFEVFMLDLSQFSGQRLKKNIQVLDFVGGHFVSKRTGQRGSRVVATTPKKQIQILRRPPQFDLEALTTLVPNE